MTAVEIMPFLAFLTEDCDRKAYIQQFLEQNGVDSAILSLAGKNHIYVKFPQNQYDSMFKIKTVIAHYDRVEGSPGANDNSAAVFCIMNWAVRLSKMNFAHNVRIIFTDGEELGENGIQEQGAFELAKVYKKLGITDEEIYVFDSMGRGNVPIICQYDLPPAMDKTFLSHLNSLENKVTRLLSSACNGRYFKLKCNYSDNASFLVNGIPSVAVTMLPSGEVENYVKNGEIPLTWRKFHTKDDDFLSLDSESFDLFGKILDNLAVQKTITEI